MNAPAARLAAVIDYGLHPSNTEFSWQPTTGERRLTDEQRAQYDRQGFVVIPDAFDASDVLAMTEAIDPLESRVAALMKRSERSRKAAADFTVTEHLVTKSDLLKEVAATGVLADLAHDCLGQRPRLDWEQAVYKKPFTPGVFPWHQDNGNVFLEPQQYITCWVALTDANEDNGCVVASADPLHRLGTLRHWRVGPALTCFAGNVPSIAVPVKAGSIVVFSSVTAHMTPANRTAATRKAWVVQYAPDDAVAVEVQPDGSVVRTPQRDKDRQYLVGDDVLT